jgi:GNAT superfamily N-acetyltransferase
LRAEALAEGRQFIERLATDWISGATRFDRAGEALFMARAHCTLAGVGGLTRDPFVPGALRMRRFYIRVAYRHSGVGRRLATALLKQAPAGILITVNAGRESIPFWEKLCFRAVTHNGHTHVLLRERPSLDQD